MLWDARKEGRQDMSNNTDVGNVIEYIDSDYYIQQINIIIRGCCLEMQIDKPDSNQINAFLRVAFNNLFKDKENTRSGGIKSRIELTEDNIHALIEVYIAVCGTWNALPSQYGFEQLTGYKFETIDKYVTGVKDSLQLARKTYIQNRLNNSPLGILTLANNDIETGLLYTRQNIVTHEAVKKSLSFEDLKRIANNIDIPEKP